VSGDLLLLHGFLGAPSSFSSLHLGRARTFAPVLLGHTGTEIIGSDEDASSAGASLRQATPTTAAPPFALELPDQPPPRFGLDHGGFEREVDRLANWASSRGFSGGTLLGYSLGGRLGLGLLVRHPSLFRRALFVSTHSGLQTDRARADRLASDLTHCRALREAGVSEFVSRWERQPLFASQATLSEAAHVEQRRVRCSHSSEGLVQSLLHCGLAAMPDYTEFLDRVDVPVTWLAGELDEKFARLAHELGTRFACVHAQIVPGAGHNLLLERPELVTRALAER
jgi:2-succinyl-6-hydroxy-2,4-cyclohexadiene-1-carboxylate synthase